MYLYAIGTMGDRQKIGYSHDPETRLKKLQTGNPESLHLHYKFEINEPTARKFEQKMHREYGYKRVKGEWFSMSPKEVIDLMQYQEIMRESIEALL